MGTVSEVSIWINLLIQKIILLKSTDTFLFFFDVLSVPTVLFYNRPLSTIAKSVARQFTPCMLDGPLHMDTGHSGGNSASMQF